jgi:Sulfate permease family
VQRSDWDTVRALAAREEVLTQPARFAVVLASIGKLPLDRKLAVLGTAAHARPRAFAVLMTAGSLYRLYDGRTAADRLTWYRSAVAVRPGSSVARYSLAMALKDKGDVDGAFACFLLAYIESVSSARAFALKHRYTVDPRQEFLGLGAASLLAGLWQGFPVAGGLSQSAVNEKGGARTPLSLVFASAVVGLVLLFFTGLLRCAS